jgi:peptidoglycan hydrolase CwlO-like protein
MKKIILGLALALMIVAPQAHAVIRNPASTDDIAALQAQIDQINSLNQQLQARVSALENAAPAAASSPVQNTQEEARIASLENRVSVLESIVNTIKTSVMAALQTTIGLLQKLLAK